QSGSSLSGVRLPSGALLAKHSSTDSFRAAEGSRRMIDASMPWRLLFLATASVLVTASLPQPSGGVREPTTCVQLNKTEEVVGVTSLDNVLAVASRLQATIHNIRQQCKKTDEVSFPVAIDKFTEFKLLNETSLFYCDTTNCSYCRFGPTHLCRVLEIRADKKDLEISSVSATQTTDGKRIFVRIVFSTQRSLTFAFEEPLLEEDRIVPIGSFVDVPYFERNQVATGFNVDGFSYFITSHFQPYEPSVGTDSESATDEVGEPTYRVKISRLCDGDGTEGLESRIDISLECPGVDDSTNRGVASATYSVAERKVFVVFSSSSSEDVVCSYSVDHVHKMMERTWNICQNTSFTRANTCIQKSRYPGKGGREHCYIFTRGGDHHRSMPCSVYSNNMDVPKYDNCRLTKYQSSAYRYGWLESYISINGSPVAVVDNRGHKYNRVFIDEAHSALFFTGDDRMARIPARFDEGKNHSVFHGRTSPSLVNFYKPSSRFALAHVVGNSFLLIDHDKVIQHDISCASLYSNCDALAKGGFSDPLQCVFCPLPDNESGGFVMERHEKTSCSLPLFESCPPIIRESAQNPVRREEWTLTGDSLQTLSNPKVLVCDQPCIINVATAGEKSLTCTLQSASVLDPTCKVKLEGVLEAYQKFTVSPLAKLPSTRDSGTQTVQGTSSSMSRTWKIVIAVIATVVIIILIVVILLAARKFLGMRQQKGNGSIGVPFETINSYPRNTARNTYLSTDPSGMPFAHNLSPAHAPAYERLFREIDSRLKIPSDHLILEKQIGKGHFGVVLKGTYNPPEGTPQAVACKTLSGHVTGGISEFVNEGLMMDRFEHPRVMTLVGISFNEDRMPIIVTAYMENGDLAKYLRDVKNKPTLRDLLNFTHEIAQGMQYLHDNKFIHRDLAARNCMLDRGLHVKVADFGLCREATSQDEYLPIHSGREMPLRWMAPEALEREQFTMAGDVWAFGVVIWEVMTRGMNPYPNLQAYVLFEFLKAGKRMGKPDFCPDILFSVMLDCWHGEPTLRPTFKDLPDSIEEIIDVLSNNSRVQMNAEYEQCNSVRNSRAASSSATTPITHHAISHVHSLPLENSPDATPV
ncbi:hypothetical protein PMAYCL1PPCAC_31646, partial [Pristionchus mayeri]